MSSSLVDKLGDEFVSDTFLISLALTPDVLAIAANKSDGKDNAIVCEALNIIISPHIEIK
jgi:hypothetical protein